TDADRTTLIDLDGRAFGAPRPQNVDLYLRSGRAMIAERGTMPAGYAFGIGLGVIAYLGSASADDGAVLLELLATLAAGARRARGAPDAVAVERPPAGGRHARARLPRLPGVALHDPRRRHRAATELRADERRLHVTRLTRRG